MLVLDKQYTLICHALLKILRRRRNLYSAPYTTIALF